MEKEQIIKRVSKYIKNVLLGESTGHDWWHIVRVQNTANFINQVEKKDSFVINMIALLHDIYDDKFSKENTRIQLINLMEKLQIKSQIKEDDLENILFSIEHLSFKGGFDGKVSLSDEGKIVQDADRIDAIGAIGIARVFAYGGKQGREIYNPDQGIVELKNEDEYRNVNRHSINHFYEKLLKIKDTINTDTGRKIAINRTNYMRKFLNEFYLEWEGKDIIISRDPIKDDGDER